MKRLIFLFGLTSLLSACAGFEDRLPHYFAIADSVLEEQAVEESETTDVLSQPDAVE